MFLSKQHSFSNKLNRNNLRNKQTKSQAMKKRRLVLECEHGYGINLEIETGSCSSMPVCHTMTMNESCVLFAINFCLLLQPNHISNFILLVNIDQ